MIDGKYPSPAEGEGSMKEQVQQLMGQVKANPKDEKSWLQLAQLYGKSWMKSGRPEAFANVEKCLNKAADLETGKFAGQFQQLLNGLGKAAKQQQNEEMVQKLLGVGRKVQENIKKAKAAADEPPPAPQAKTDTPPSPPQEQDEFPVPEIPQAPPEVAPEVPDISDIQGMPPVQDSGEVEVPAEDLIATPPSAPPQVDITGLGEEEVSEEETWADPLGGVDAEADSAMESALDTDEERAFFEEIDRAFDEADVENLIRLYMDAPAGAVRIRIVEGLVKRLEDWGVEPVLAVAAVENEEHMFRQIVRLLLRADRAQICQDIELDQYSPDLQKIAVAILGELGLRSALMKLEQALELPDPTVRSIALSGISRAGKAAHKYIPTLVKIAHADPNNNVRFSAAKAIQAMNMEEAYEALEKATNDFNFDARIYEVLEQMREQFGVLEKKAGKVKKGGKGEPTFWDTHGPKVLQVVGIVAVLLALVFFYVIPQLKKLRIIE